MHIDVSERGARSRIALAIAALALGACGTSDHSPDAVTSPWQPGPALPGPRLEPGVAALGDRLALVGGFDAGLSIVTRADVLDVNSGTWSSLPDAPVAWTHVDLLGVAGGLYLLGGLETTTFTPSGRAFVLDANLTSWRELTAMPAGLERGAAGVTAIPPHLIVAGGATATASVATVLVYDLSTDSWSQLPDLPAARSHPALGHLADGTLVLTGGLATLDATQPASDTWLLLPNATAWQVAAPMPTPRGGCAYGMIGDRLLCVGGEAGAAALHTAEAYTTATDTWETLDPMPTPRAGTQGAVIGTRMFVPGGARKLAYEPDGTMDVYTVR
ncbi:MAG: hypothetical protein K8W52_42075 [Deltaproteobacteria bacterium]|nr:hypothetical protein [Deltaproteobacteria bacterium]